MTKVPKFVLRLLYDLEGRTLEFSKRIIKLCKTLQKDAVNREFCRQVIRLGSSVGANYREANETDTKRDFLHRIRISKKEAKETYHWIQLIIEANPEMKPRCQALLSDTKELLMILSSIYEKVKKR